MKFKSRPRTCLVGERFRVVTAEEMSEGVFGEGSENSQDSLPGEFNVNRLVQRMQICSFLSLSDVWALLSMKDLWLFVCFKKLCQQRALILKLSRRGPEPGYPRLSAQDVREGCAVRCPVDPFCAAVFGPSFCVVMPLSLRLLLAVAHTCLFGVLSWGT